MCEFSAKLIAWMDGELPLDEAGVLEKHIESCPECTRRLAAYQQASEAFAAFCDAAFADSVRKGGLRRVAAAVAAIAAGVVLVLFFPRTRTEPVILLSPSTARPPAIAFQTTPAPKTMPARVAAIRPSRMLKLTAAKNPARPPDQPEIQIALPADAMFPPGAIPEGFSFIANVSVAADGSLAVALRP